MVSPSSSQPPEQLPRHSTEVRIPQWLGLVIALIIGGAARFYAPLTENFPIMDGGLFLLMSQQIKAEGFALPATVPYGTIVPELPFCYPPLAFYQAALLNAMGISLETILRFLPAIWSTASIYALWSFTRTLVKDRPKANEIAGFAAIVWALLPTTFFWMVMGGGLTRAPGLFFAIMGVDYAIRYWRDQQKSASYWLIAFLALAILTHLERARFLTIALLLVWLVYAAPRNWRTLWQPILVVVSAIALASPWWLLCLSRFGLEPFLGAVSSGASGWPRPSTLGVLLSLESLPLLTTISLIASILFVRSYPLLLIWIIAILASEVRSPANFITIPIAVCVALVFYSINNPRFKVILATTIICWGSYHSFMVTTSYYTLSPAMREAMSWVKAQTPSNARFLLLPDPPNRFGWIYNLSAEWFPALSLRANVLTVQGTEWLPDNAFTKQRNNHDTLVQAKSWPEVKTISRKLNLNYDWLLIPKNGTNYSKMMQIEASRDADFRRVYENEDALILQRR